MKAITKESLNNIGFSRYGWEKVGKTNPLTGIQIVFNFVHNTTEVICLNDSVPIDNCRSMDDIKDLMRLFNIKK